MKSLKKLFMAAAGVCAVASVAAAAPGNLCPDPLTPVVANTYYLSGPGDGTTPAVGSINRDGWEGTNCRFNTQSCGAASGNGNVGFMMMLWTNQMSETDGQLPYYFYLDNATTVDATSGCQIVVQGIFTDDYIGNNNLYGSFHVTVKNSFFRDQSGLALIYAIPPGSSINFGNNTFVNYMYMSGYGCTAMMVLSHGFPDNTRININSNTFQNFTCTSSYLATGAVFVGYPSAGRLGYNASIDVSNNSVTVNCPSTGFFADTTNYMQLCDFNALNFGAVQISPGSNVTIESNTISLPGMSPGMLLNFFSFLRVDEINQPHFTSPGTLSVSHNHFRCYDGHYRCFAIYMDQNFATLNISQPEGGNIFFDYNQFDDFAYGSYLVFPPNADINRLDTLPFNISFSYNVINSAHLIKVLSIGQIFFTVAGSIIRLVGNDYSNCAPNTNTNSHVFYLQNNFDINNTRIHVYNNIGPKTYNHIAFFGMSATVLYTAKHNSPFLFCNNSYAGVVLEDNSDDFKELLLDDSDHYPLPYATYYCYQCGCLDSNPAEGVWCRKPASCCSFDLKEPLMLIRCPTGGLANSDNWAPIPQLTVK